MSKLIDVSHNGKRDSIVVEFTREELSDVVDSIRMDSIDNLLNDYHTLYDSKKELADGLENHLEYAKEVIL